MKRKSLNFKSDTLKTFKNCSRTPTCGWTKWRVNTWHRRGPQYVCFSVPCPDELSSSPPCPHASLLPEHAVHGKCAVEQKPLTFLPDTGSHVAVCGLFSGRRISLGIDCYHFFFFFFFTPANVYKTFFLFFCFFSPLTFTLEIISLLFCFLFYLFVSVFLTEEVIVFLEMCNACGKTVRSGGGAAWL